MSDLDEIESMLRGDGDLRQRIVRDLGRCTTALFGVLDANGGDRLELAGTGTFATVAASHGILTAAHVWDCGLKSAAKVGITLTDNINHKCLIDTQTIVATVVRASKWNEWGPDMAFLQIPEALVGGIEAFQTFEDLSKPPKPLNADALECWVAMGTPKELGTFTGTHAEVQISGDFVDPRHYARGGHDYYDFEVDTTREGMPKSFGGFSGGGLWRVPVYRSRSTGKIEWAQRLKGVIFWQFPIINGKRVIRSHGPESIEQMPNQVKA